MGVPPKSSILMGCSIINQPFSGAPIYGNPHMGLSENRMGYPQNSTEKNPHFHLYGLHPPLFRVTPTNIQFSWLLCVLKSHSITRNYHIPSNHHKITINHDQSPQHHKTITTESSEQNTINYMCL